jgi:alpha-amylase/alpha-mannosidase (GH57 family)
MTKVALLWHMHQPYYEDLVTGEHILPWVRLHALKDYYGMVALLEEFPGVRVTFNLVPSLLVQVEAYAENRARDRHLEVGLKPADALSDEERHFAVQNFFHAQQARMIDPYPRYAELQAKRQNAMKTAARDGNLRLALSRAFSEADIRDLQVWHKLTWIEQAYKDGDRRVRMLVAKERAFSEDDKLLLREVELELLRRVVPAYRDAAARGQVELSTSPFYHPILPLLCDTDVYLRTHPHSRMPRQRFVRPDDAAEQLRRAAAMHARLFSAAPAGVWPSEGSVSEAMVPLVAKAGFSWMASDEVILARTLNVSLTRDGAGHVEQPEILYRPYLVSAGGAEVACLFRDHTLSDLIGFTYSGWNADAAAQDFVGRLLEAGRRFTARSGGEEAVIPVILDGENAWEHFEASGRPFLRALYQRLSSTAGLQAVTMADACRAPTRRELNGIFPGSWINGDFYIWIGHADDHRAWSQLGDAREVLDHAAAGVGERALAQAREEILIAEGSDWFWWYGDDHSSEHDLEFDDLFRRHLRNVYVALGKPVPEELFVTNITTQAQPVEVWAPTGFVHPTLDGEVSSYFEWIGAGAWEPRADGGTMQASERRPGVVRAVLFGFDLSTLYIRIDASRHAREVLAEGLVFIIRFAKPGGLRLEVREQGGQVQAALMERKPDAGWTERPSRVRAVAASVIEAAVPFAELGVTAGQELALSVAVLERGAEIERHPSYRPIESAVPTDDFEALNWTA